MSADQFRAFAADLGYELPQSIEPGRRFRFSVNGKRADDAGWGTLFSDGLGGVVGDWRTGAKHVWQAKRDRKLSPTENRALQERIEREKREAQEERERDAKEAARRAVSMWETLQPVSEDHEYLLLKGVRPNGLRIYSGPRLTIRDMDCEDALVMALRNSAGEISSLEFIGPGGEKRFLPGGAYRGCYFGIGGAPAEGKPLCIAEGFATGASIHESTGYGVAVAATAGNLEPVAVALRAKYPDTKIIVCADDDAGTPGNPGLAKATEAAAAASALVAFPHFPRDRPKGSIDFNDLANALGQDAVKAALSSARAPAPAQVGDVATTAQASQEVVRPTQSLASSHALLDALYAFLSRFIAYPSDNARTAHALWIAHAHMMDAWESTPRIAFLSPEPGSGKTRALEITETLVPRPVEQVNTTPAYLFRKISDPEGAPTILYDEIDTVFGPKAKDNEEIRGILNAGHRRGAMAGRCVMRGKVVETEELPAYCAVAMAGLGHLPDTILSRAIVVRMRRRAPGERVEAYRRRVHSPEGNALRDRLAAWGQAIAPTLRGAWPEMPPGIEDRDADVWEAPLAIADAAGGDWPTRARAAAVALVADAKQTTPSLGVRLLADLKAIFGTREHMSSEDIIRALVQLDEAPWADMKGKPIDSRRLAGYLRQYGVRSRNIRVADGVAKGYAIEDLYDPWSRYLQVASLEAATSATSATATAPEPADDRELFG